MLKKLWDFVKENVAAIVTVTTATLTVVYAALRLCLYVYWRGYFIRLNIDASIMDLNFDKSIFAVVFVSITLLVVLFFMAWTFEIIENIKNKESEQQLKGARKMLYKIKSFIKGLFLSLIILSMINVPLELMLAALVPGANVTLDNMVFLFILLYAMEMLFVITQVLSHSKHKKSDKLTEREIAIIIVEVLAFVLVILAMLFYGGSYAIDSKTSVQLVENEEYVISYSDGERYVLHKVKCNGEEITIYRNEQKIVSVEDYEYSIKKVKKVLVED